MFYDNKVIKHFQNKIEKHIRTIFVMVGNNTNNDFPSGTGLVGSWLVVPKLQKS